MKQVLFAKYNRTRKPEFQISTIICEENGVRSVEKRSLTDIGRKHVANLAVYARVLSEVYPDLQFPEPVIVGEGEAAVFPYIQGVSYDSVLKDALTDRKRLEKTLDQFLSMICTVSGEYRCTFEKTEAFVSAFGDADFESGTDAVKVMNVDMTADNLMLTEDGICCIDFEWVCRFPVPVVFLKYRTLYYFYNRYRSQLKQTFPEDEYWQYFGMDRDMVDTCAAMEVHFQEYVDGKDHECRYTDRYRKTTINIFERSAYHEEEIRQLQDDRKLLMDNYDRLEADKKELDYQFSRLHFEHQELKARADSQKDLIDQLEDLTTKMDAHIKAIQPGFEKWTAFKERKMIKLLRLPRRYRAYMDRKREERRRFLPIDVPQSDEPVVSIILPVYNQFAYTYECVKSIIEYTKDIPYEIIVGDDVSTDQTRQLEQYIRGVTVLHNTENLKFLLNCNQAAKHAKGKYIFFLNNDTKVTENWLGSLVELIESDDSIGMVGSKLIYPDGRLQEAGGIIFSDASGWNYGRFQDPDSPEYNYVKDVDYISGAAIMIRASLWKEIGGFDERFAPAYYEDTDLAFQVREHGYRVVYQPQSVVIHFEGVSNGTDTSSGLKKYQVVNARHFLEKWKDRLEEDHCSGPEELFVARERSGKKKMVVFVDHYVPHFDQDAGSKSTFSYIKAFLQMGYSVKFIGDNFYKHEPYTTALQQMGVEVLYGDWYFLNWQTWIEENGRYFDVVFMNRPHITIKYIKLFREHTKARLIYYGHDLHYIRERREYEITKNEETLKDAEQMHQTEYMIMRMADVVYYPSYVEVDLIHEEDPSIHARAIPVYVYEEPYRGQALPVRERRDLLFVGGFAHTPNVDAVLWFVREIFPKVLEQISDIRFYIVGSKAPQEILDLDSEQVIVKGFVSDEELAELYRTCRLDVVPLRYGAGVKGKIIEGVYNHIPLITTSIGAEGLVDYERVIAVEDDAQSFAERIIALYGDEKKLTDMADHCDAFIRDYFSIQAAMNIIKEDL